MKTTGAVGVGETTEAVQIEVGAITRVRVVRGVGDTEEIEVEVVAEDTTPQTMEDSELSGWIVVKVLILKLKK